MKSYSELETKDLWKYFRAVTAIPRESGNEEGVRRMLLDFAAEHGFDAKTDEIGNVIITCPATPGYEDAPAVALQGHMDMVCVKTKDSKHDFTKDPIELLVDGDRIRAKDTSLGGDDGIAIATALAIFTDKDAKHGKLEGIFTVSEETSLVGASNLDPKNVTSRRLINIDSEEEGTIYIGCAGGIDTTAVFDAPSADPDPRLYPIDSMWRLEVSGLLGGHSGGEIHKERANAIKLAARIIHTLGRKMPIMLSSFTGGTRRNVIPSSAEVEFTAPAIFNKDIKNVVESAVEDIKNEFRVQDPGITVTLEKVPAKGPFVSELTSYQVINALYTAPNGVASMSMTLPGIVETSTNLAIVNIGGEKGEIIASHRSSILSARNDIAEQFATCMRAIEGSEVSHSDGYPGWQPNPESPLALLCADAWEKETGKKPEITAIHAGLECGIINSLIPGMDSVSIGPDMSDVHSVNESLSISSSERILEFVKKLLADMK